MCYRQEVPFKGFSLGLVLETTSNPRFEEKKMNRSREELSRLLKDLQQFCEDHQIKIHGEMLIEVPGSPDSYYALRQLRANKLGAEGVSAGDHYGVGRYDEPENRHRDELAELQAMYDEPDLPPEKVKQTLLRMMRLWSN